MYKKATVILQVAIYLKSKPNAICLFTYVALQFEEINVTITDHHKLILQMISFDIHIIDFDTNFSK